MKFIVKCVMNKYKLTANQIVDLTEDQLKEHPWKFLLESSYLERAGADKEVSPEVKEAMGVVPVPSNRECNDPTIEESFKVEITSEKKKQEKTANNFAVQTRSVDPTVEMQVTQRGEGARTPMATTSSATSTTNQRTFPSQSMKFKELIAALDAGSITDKEELASLLSHENKSVRKRAEASYTKLYKKA